MNIKGAANVMWNSWQWPANPNTSHIACNKQQDMLVLSPYLLWKTEAVSDIKWLTINYSVEHQVNKAVGASTPASITAIHKPRHKLWDKRWEIH